MKTESLSKKAERALNGCEGIARFTGNLSWRLTDELCPLLDKEFMGDDMMEAYIALHDANNRLNDLARKCSDELEVMVAALNGRELIRAEIWPKDATCSRVEKDFAKNMAAAKSKARRMMKERSGLERVCLSKRGADEVW